MTRLERALLWLLIFNQWLNDLAALARRPRGLLFTCFCLVSALFCFGYALYRAWDPLPNPFTREETESDRAAQRRAAGRV